MATEADLIQKFKDLNIPVGADFEELIHAAFAGANLADIVNSYDYRIATVETDLTTKADDSKVVHDNHDGTEQLNGVQVQPFNKLTDTVGVRNYIATNSWIALGQYGYYSAYDGSSKHGVASTVDIYSDYISISPQTMLFTWYSLPTGGSATVHTYDATKTWIKSFQISNAVGSTKIDLPSNTGYIAINVPNPNIRGGQSTLTIGDVKTDWTPAPEDKADDSKVVHNSGANNFDTVPTVNNNPLLLASSLPSDLARTGQDANFTGKLQKSGIDVATTTDVTTAVSTATANMVDSSKPTNFTAGLQSGGVDVATAADLKSVKESAWRQLDNKYITSSFTAFTVSSASTVLYKIDDTNKRLYLQGSIILTSNVAGVDAITLNLGSIVKKVLSFNGAYLGYIASVPDSWDWLPATADLTFSPQNGLVLFGGDNGIASKSTGPIYITYDELV